jgi:hypothetical protein
MPTQRPMTLGHLSGPPEESAENAGHPNKHGHSICIGATLEYPLRGVPFEAMKSIGRWSSDSFSRYAQILAPYALANPNLREPTYAPRAVGTAAGRLCTGRAGKCYALCPYCLHAVVLKDQNIYT